MQHVYVSVCMVSVLFLISRVPFHFGEHGNYSLWVKNLNDSSVVNCSVVTDADPVNSYIREYHSLKHIHKLVYDMDICQVF